MLERRRPGPERIEALEVEQLLVRLDRRERHPIEREQQHEENERERQIKRHEASRQRLQVAHALAMVGGDAGQHRLRACDLRREHVSHDLALRLGTRAGACSKLGLLPPPLWGEGWGGGWCVCPRRRTTL